MLLRYITYITVVLLLLGCTVVAAKRRSDVDPKSITRVHVVFSNHLDVGFVDTSTNIVNRYFTEFFPRAISVTNEMRTRGQDRYIWMTQSYLVSLYMDCPTGFGLKCPSASEVAAFTAAVERGDITWHAFPFNAQLETLDPSLFRWGIQMTHDLDIRFNRTASTVLSQRDVPGMTRGVIPLLNQVGIKAITVGVNGFSAPPNFPSVFTWVDVASNTSVYAMWHPGDYGGILVKDAVMVQGWNTALLFNWRGDNAGPGNVSEIEENYKQIRQEFPNAQVFASTLDAFVAELSQVQSVLPVYTEEVGDTWIYGIASDPYKLQAFRTLQHARTMCLENDDCELKDPVITNFSRILIKNSEHTWGGDVKTFLHAYDPTVNYYYQWSNQAFAKVATSAPYQELVGTWYEQRHWGINYAIDAVPKSHSFYPYIADAMKAIQPVKINMDGYLPVDFNTTFLLNNWQFQFSSDGSLASLLDIGLGIQWVDIGYNLGQVVYQTFTEDDVNHFLQSYANCDYIKDCNWGYYDFGKVNCSNASPQTQTVIPKLRGLYQKHTTFLADVIFDNELSMKYGAPTSIQLEWDFGTQVQLTVHINNKSATRLPESLWVRFNPNVASSTPSSSSTWTLSKLGSWIDPTHLIVNGSTHLHATDEMRAYSVNASTPILITITSLDAPLATISYPLSPFPTPLHQKPDQSQGIAYNLVNNIWGTNYVMWYPFGDISGDLLYRFQITSGTPN